VARYEHLAAGLDAVGRALAWYWNWAGSNIGAMPACGLVGLLTAGPLTWLLRDRIGHRLAGWWHRHLGHRAELDELRATADRALQIAADLYEHHTGTPHPLAPGGSDEPA
jgi:hypothetical protein